LLQRQKTAPQALLGNPKNLRGGTYLSLPRKLDEGANLIGAQLWKDRRHSDQNTQIFRLLNK